MKLGSDPLPTLPYDNEWREHAESEGSASSSAGNEETGNIISQVLYDSLNGVR